MACLGMLEPDTAFFTKKIFQASKEYADAYYCREAILERVANELAPFLLVKPPNMAGSKLANLWHLRGLP